MRFLSGLFLAIALPGLAQSNVVVQVDDVTDNRVVVGELRGGLELRLKLDGKNLDKALASRILVKEARDDQGTDLVGKSSSTPDFFPREYNMGTVQVGLLSPARTASEVKMKGTVELYVPSRDPAAVVRIDKGLSRLDKPLSAKGLKAAKVDLTPVSREGFLKALESQKLDEKKLEAIRAEGKARGVPEKEVELMIGLAQALEMSGSDVPDGAIIFSGRKESFDRIYRIDVLDAEGKPIDTGSRSQSTRGEDVILVMQPNQPPPPNATVQVQLLTQKSRMSTPFELTVELP